VRNRSELAREVRRLFEDYPGVPILAEEYIPGQEITVGVLGNRPAALLGMMEMAFRDSSEKDFCYSLEVKRDWKKLVEYYSPPRVDARIEKEIENASLRFFKTLGLRDFARFDFRINPEGRSYFLEVNPLPGLNPESGDLVILAQKKGWSYQELVLNIAQAGAQRYSMSILTKEMLRNR
jgi:D-alanine-D-alanine ligase